MKKIGVFYSVGPHLLKCLHTIRSATPDGKIDLYIPAGHALTNTERSLATNVITTELAHYAPTNIVACLKLIRSIRHAQLDEFVVMFDSVQLCILASLSNASLRTHCAPHGATKPIASSTFSVVAQEVQRRIHGLYTYVTIWIAVRVRRVRSDE